MIERCEQSYPASIMSRVNERASTISGGSSCSERTSKKRTALDGAKFISCVINAWARALVVDFRAVFMVDVRLPEIPFP